MKALTMAVVMVVAVDCVGAESGGTGDVEGGSGPDAVSTTGVSGGTTSASTASSGGGSHGGATPTESEDFTLSIGQLDGCPSARVVGPLLPEEAGAIALGRFAPEELPASLTAFSFIGEPELGQCADLATEVVYWASASAAPEETPAGAHVVTVPSTRGSVMVQLDPPLELTPERPYGFVGLRMAAAGDKSVCIVACPASERLDDNWWSNAPAAPYGWDRPIDSAPDDEPGTPGDGLAWDYVFSVSGHSE